jgi:peptidoglycan/LPS O-acetylase OafA/YrhL
MNGSDFSIPLWLIFFVLAGFLLFILKISSDRKSAEPETKRFISLRLFLIIAMALLTIAGLAHFYRWVQPY